MRYGQWPPPLSISSPAAGVDLAKCGSRLSFPLTRSQARPMWPARQWAVYRIAETDQHLLDPRLPVSTNAPGAGTIVKPPRPRHLHRDGRDLSVQKCDRQRPRHRLAHPAVARRESPFVIGFTKTSPGSRPTGAARPNPQTNLLRSTSHRSRPRFLPSRRIDPVPPERHVTPMTGQRVTFTGASGRCAPRRFRPLRQS